MRGMGCALYIRCALYIGARYLPQSTVDGILIHVYSNLCRKLYIDVSLETPEWCITSVLGQSSLRGAGNRSKPYLHIASAASVV
jgi:hypothetical protein